MELGLHGITIQLYEKTVTGKDAFNADIYTETAVDVENVIVGNPTEQEVLDVLNLTGRKAVYQLGIPKGDEHDWTDVKVGFFGQLFHTIGAPVQGIDDLIPGPWNAKVRVERYE